MNGLTSIGQDSFRYKSQSTAITTGKKGCFAPERKYRDSQGKEVQ